MNSTFFFIVMIVAIVMCAEVIKTWMKQKNQKPEIDQELQDTLARIDEVEERIRVLERIVTENRVDLKQQIDNL